MSDVDTLTKYGPSFQNKCLAVILKNKEYLEQILDMIKDEFFDSDAYKWILNTTIEYYYEYKRLPTLEVFKHKLDSVSDDLLKLSVVETLKSILTQQKADDLPYIESEFLQFCRNQTLKTAIIESADLLALGEYEKIKHTVDTALKAGMEPDTGHDYNNNIDERLSDDARDTVKTNWDVIDEALDGGLGPGELGVFIAPAGAGKSWCLNRIGVEALKQAKNVVHITLELQQNYVGRRYDCCFTGVDFQSIVNHKDAVERCVENLKGWLKIKYYPIKSISALTIKNYVERIQTLSGEKVDLLVVDYADILCSQTSDKNSNSYSEGGSIYEELRCIAGELGIPCWTASQANRGQTDEDVIEAGGVADSYRKIMTADVVISISRKTADKLQNTARAHVIKNRFGADGMTFPAHFDASCGDIRLYDQKSSEASEVKSRMNDGENAAKNRIKEVWNKVKDDHDDLG